MIFSVFGLVPSIYFPSFRGIFGIYGIAPIFFFFFNSHDVNYIVIVIIINKLNNAVSHIQGVALEHNTYFTLICHESAGQTAILGLTRDQHSKYIILSLFVVPFPPQLLFIDLRIPLRKSSVV